jgi:hypothetical protein
MGGLLFGRQGKAVQLVSYPNGKYPKKRSAIRHAVEQHQRRGHDISG